MLVAAIGLGFCFPPHACGQLTLTGNLGVHDPSRIVEEGRRYYSFSTGNIINSKRSTDLVRWDQGPDVFDSPPAWTQQEVPANSGNFWAPSVINHNGEYRVYYSVSSFGSQDSAIGLVTNATLDFNNRNYQWVDQGLVIDSEAGSPYNAIDPATFFDAETGRMWLAFGSFWNGVFLTELDPDTGMRVSGNPPVVHLAEHEDTSPNAIEAPYIHYRDGYYYLFVNWGTCCSGVDSTYNIRVGRSRQVHGPYIDRTRTQLRNGGGDLFLATEDRYIGPGHMSIFSEEGTDYFSYHYYDGLANGASRYALDELGWTIDGWPVPARKLFPGDFDLSGDVDDDDLVLWQRFFGNTASGQDFLTWQRNQGAVLATAEKIDAVPEASSAAICVIGITLAWLAWRQNLCFVARRRQTG